MAIGTPLSNVVAMLRAELSSTLIVGVADADITQYACMIAEKQRWLSDLYDWPFLEDFWDVGIAQGQRYNNLPLTVSDELGLIESLNRERPFQTNTFWGGDWISVVYGIEEQEFNYLNSDGNPPDSSAQPQTNDPIQRWRYSTGIQFEVWPVPASNSIFRFRGQRTNTQLLSFNGGIANVANITPIWSAPLDLDDNLVMLHAASELLANEGKANAQLVRARAQARLACIRASYPSRDMPCGFGNKHIKQWHQLVPVKRIIIAGNNPSP